MTDKTRRNGFWQKREKHFWSLPGGMSFCLWEADEAGEIAERTER